MEYIVNTIPLELITPFLLAINIQKHEMIKLTMYLVGNVVSIGSAIFLYELVS